MSADGLILASSDDSLVRVWEVEACHEVARVNHEGHLGNMVFARMENLTATAGISAVLVWLWRREDLIAEACASLTHNPTPEGCKA